MADQSLLDPRIVQQVKATPRLSDVAYEAIREAISSGRVKAGQSLRQEALAQELGISQVTVREALNRLVAEGLAVAEPYKGVKVVMLPFEDLEDIYAMRAQLEGLAMELAADRLAPSDLERMRELLPHTAATADPESVERARQANREFHWLAINASDRRYLIRTLGQLWDLTVTYVLLVQDSQEGRIQASRDDLVHHCAIVEALEAHDGRRARELTVEHIHRTLETMRARLAPRAVQ